MPGQLLEWPSDRGDHVAEEEFFPSVGADVQNLLHFFLDWGRLLLRGRLLRGRLFRLSMILLLSIRFALNLSLSLFNQGAW